jgi:hypothetical protein
MFADPHEIRALARRVREQGHDVRGDAHDLTTRSRAVGWTGLSGTAMAGATGAGAADLTRIAGEHEVAARALELHAAAVEEAVALVVEIEHRVRSAVDGARERVGRFLGGLVDAIDPVDEVLTRFVPPAPGSPEWLHVRLPGVAHPGLPR